MMNGVEKSKHVGAKVKNYNFLKSIGLDHG